MDPLTFALFAIFALIVVAGLIVYFKRGGRFAGKIGPKGLELSTQDQDKSAIKMENVTAKKGNVTAETKSGEIVMQGVNAGKNVTAKIGDDSKKT